METNLEEMQKALDKERIIITLVSVPGTLALGLAAATLLSRGEIEPLFPFLESNTAVNVLLAYGVISFVCTLYRLLKILQKQKKLEQAYLK